MEITNSELSEYLQNLLQEKYSAFIESKPEPTAIKINTLKIGIEDFKKKLDRWGVEYRPHPANPSGLILSEDTLPLSHTLSFFKGEFSYQGVASQLPVIALDPKPGETVLDLAASPGSKSTQIAAMLNNTGRVLVNDPSMLRHRILSTNMSRAGVLNDISLIAPGQQFGQLLPNFFDRVLVDSPCTALGTLASHPGEINTWWSLNKLKKLTNLQLSLLVSGIKTAKVNGTIVYSTCSIAPEENEQLIDKIVKEYPVEVEEIYRWPGLNLKNGFTTYENQVFHSDLKKTVRTSPETEPIEGFFMARLRKTAAQTYRGDYKKMVFKPFSKADDAEIKPLLEYLYNRWGIEPEIFSKYHFINGKKRTWLVSSEWDELPANSVIKAGITLVDNKSFKRKLTNSSVQVFKKYITKSIFEVDEKQLKKLFKFGQFEYSGLKEGYYVLSFQGENIGVVSFFKNLIKIRLPHRFDLVI